MNGHVRVYTDLLRRLRIGIGVRRGADRIMVLSGLFGIPAGVMILSGWPASGLWLLGLLVGIDLIFRRGRLACSGLATSDTKDCRKMAGG